MTESAMEESWGLGSAPISWAIAEGCLRPKKKISNKKAIALFSIPLFYLGIIGGERREMKLRKIRGSCGNWELLFQKSGKAWKINKKNLKNKKTGRSKYSHRKLRRAEAWWNKRKKIRMHSSYKEPQFTHLILVRKRSFIFFIGLLYVTWNYLLQWKFCQ